MMNFTLNIGNSIRRSIDKGLNNSRYGLVILSSSFFKKEWTNYELDGIIATMKSNVGVLPIWLGVDKAEVSNYSPSLSNLNAIIAENHSIKSIADKLSPILGVKLYECGKDGSVNQRSKAEPIPDKVRERGFQCVKVKQTDRIIDRIHTQARADIIIYPLSPSYNQHPFYFWQATKGDINLIRITVYDYNSGEMMDSINEIVQNDGFKFKCIDKFSLDDDTKPIRIVSEIATTNQIRGLFDEGTEYMEFNINSHHELFEYSLIMPASKEFENIEVFANDTKLEATQEAGERVFKHSIHKLKAGTELKYTFVNRDIYE